MTRNEINARWYRKRAKDPAWLEKRRAAARAWRARMKREGITYGHGIGPRQKPRREA